LNIAICVTFLHICIPYLGEIIQILINLNATIIRSV